VQPYFKGLQLIFLTLRARRDKEHKIEIIRQHLIKERFEYKKTRLRNFNDHLYFT